MRWVTLIFSLLLVGCLQGQSYFLNGDAQFSAGNCYTITPNVAWQNGTVWYAEQLNLNESFSLEFLMNFGSTDANGADGMVFVLQTVGTNAIGIDGSGMGFQGFNPSFGIEFDTFSNNETADPATDHVAFLRNGVVDHNSSANLAGPVQAAGTSANIEDGQDHIIRITWNPSTQIVELYFDCVLRLSDQNNLINGIFGGNPNVYWGFTGATGFYYNPQTVCLQEYYFTEMNDSTICVGESIVLAAPGNPQGDFIWTPAAGLDDPASQNPTATPDATTEYCYTYTDLCGNTFSNCHTVFVESPPVVDCGADALFCEGSNYEIIATCDQPDAQLLWSTVDGEILGSTNEVAVVVQSAGTYVLQASSPGAGCISEDEVVITQIPLPDFEPDSPVLLCPNELVMLNTGDDWDAVLWFNGSNGNGVEVSSGGQYDVTITQQGCSSTFVFEVEEVDMPVVYLGEDFDICEGEDATLTSGLDGIWSTGETGTFINVATGGIYHFTYFEENCIAGDTIAVSVAESPQIELGPDFSFCEGETVTIEIPYIGSWSTGEMSDEIVITETGTYGVLVSSGPCTVTDEVQATMINLPLVSLGDDASYCRGNAYTIGMEDANAEDYVWSTGESTSTIDIRDGGVYWVQVSNQCGDAVDTVAVAFSDCDVLIYIPDAFTPDGDGLNDVFFVLANNLIKPEFNIYNRWGMLIFSTTDLTVPWTGDVMDGTHYAPDGVYTYQLKYLTDKGDAGEVRGHVTLLR